MKKMKALQIIAAAMAVTVAATSAPVHVFAYGETSANSTVFTDTQNISDYTTWKAITNIKLKNNIYRCLDT